MKKAFFRLLLVVFGLNVFTACYGMPPGDWAPTPLPEEQEQSKAPELGDSDEKPGDSDEELGAEESEEKLSEE